MLRGLWFIVLIFMAHAELPDLGSPSHTPLSQQTRRELAGEIMGELYRQKVITDDVVANHMLNRIGTRLLADHGVRARFHAASIKEPNAFALPDGQIVVHLGLIHMAEREDELAAVLAHEIAHVAKRHIDQMVGLSKKLMLQQILGLALGVAIGVHDQDVGSTVAMASNAMAHQSMLSFSREREFEADEVAHEIILLADYDPYGMVDMFKHFEDMRKYHGSVPTYLLTHPQSEARVNSAKSWAEQYPTREVTESEYDFERAYLIAEDISMHKARAKTQVETAPEKFGAARLAMRQGDYPGALTLLKDLPENYLVTISAAECHLHLQAYGDAQKTLWQALPKYRQNNAYTLLAGSLMLEAGSPDKAAVLLELSENGKKQSKLLSKAYHSLGKPVAAKMSEADYWVFSGERSRALRLIEEALKTPQSQTDTARLKAKLDELNG